MSIHHAILVEGNSLRFKEGFFGFSTTVLVLVDGYEPVLFDTGHHLTRLMLLSGLKQHGLTPADIRMVFLSHLHFDHANNVDLFPQADIYLGAEEWSYARKPADEDPFCSTGMNHYLQDQPLHLLDQPEGELLPGLFYRHAPGHTPGSYLLHYTADDGRRVVLAGDACKTYRELAGGHSASEFDPHTRSAQTLAWIADNADVVVPGHFPELRRTPAGWMWDEPMRLELIVR
ncbi:MBL fold metallo-hydrolase [Castellaniella sp.]|uniref:MBL fold metallo-hydrolase n=1 Tax=Castellaniella sp. TaxID=1955812 RepID=UPI003A910669